LTWAAAIDGQEASTIAASEGMERWGIGQWWTDLTARGADLNHPYLNPTKFVNLEGRSLRGFRTAPFDPDSQRGWLLGQDEHGRPTYVLAEQVVSTAGYDAATTEVHFPSWSSGASAHPVFTQALRNAQEEVAERSAVLNWWLFDTSAVRIPSRLQRDLLPAQLHDFIYANDGSLVVLPSQAGIHAVLCVFRLPDGGAVLGSAGATSLDTAVFKAAKEAVVGIAWLRSAAGIEDPTRVVSPLDHSLLYRSPKFGAQLLASIDALPEDSAPEALAAGRVERVVYVRHPVSDVLGTNIVRCIGVDSLPMYFGFGNEPLSEEAIQKIRSAGPTWHRSMPLSGGLLPHPIG
jgi:hypothetical protein